MEEFSSLIPLLLLVGLFYLLILRPARARQRETLALQASLEVGQDVMTTSGLHGRIVTLTDDDVVLEIAPGMNTTWTRAAIGQVRLPVVADDETPDVLDLRQSERTSSN